MPTGHTMMAMTLDGFVARRCPALAASNHVKCGRLRSFATMMSAILSPGCAGRVRWLSSPKPASGY